MTKPQATIHNAITGETIVRDMTAEEIEANTITVELPTPATE
jgi:hypothetical protein